jgi:hypothetical protein
MSQIRSHLKCDNKAYYRKKELRCCCTLVDSSSTCTTFDNGFAFGTQSYIFVGCAPSLTPYPLLAYFSTSLWTNASGFASARSVWSSRVLFCTTQGSQREGEDADQRHPSQLYVLAYLWFLDRSAWTNYSIRVTMASGAKLPCA